VRVEGGEGGGGRGPYADANICSVCDELSLSEACFVLAVQHQSVDDASTSAVVKNGTDRQRDRHQTVALHLLQ